MQIHSAEAAAQPWGANPCQEVSLSDSLSSPSPPLRSFDQLPLPSPRYSEHGCASASTHAPSTHVCVSSSRLSPQHSLIPWHDSSSAVKWAPLILPLSFPLSVKSPPLFVCERNSMSWPSPFLHLSQCVMFVRMFFFLVCVCVCVCVCVWITVTISPIWEFVIYSVKKKKKNSLYCH